MMTTTALDEAVAAVAKACLLRPKRESAVVLVAVGSLEQAEVTELSVRTVVDVVSASVST